MLRDQSRFLCSLGAHLEQACPFSSGWAVKLETAIQQRTGDILHLHPNCHVPLGRVGSFVEGSFEEIRCESSQIMACLSNSSVISTERAFLPGYHSNIKFPIR